MPNIKYENSYRSDHSPVILEYKLIYKWEMFWKFIIPYYIVVDMAYINSIKKKIGKIKENMHALYTTSII